MNYVDQLLVLITSFTLKRAVSLIFILTVLLFTSWLIDSNTYYTKLRKLEKTTELLERIDTLDRKGNLSEDVKKARDAILAELPLLQTDIRVIRADAQVQASVNPASKYWNIASLPRFGWWSLPWFMLSLVILPNVAKKKEGALASFFAFQILTIFFGVVGIITPIYGNFVVDSLIIPWSVMFVCAFIPISYAATRKVVGYKKVREDSLRKAITNNLRMISAAADQYVLDNGKPAESLSDLVGLERNKYIKGIMSVDGESYEHLDLRPGQVLEVKSVSGIVVRYPSE